MFLVLWCLLLVLPAGLRGQSGFPYPDGVRIVQTRPAVETVQPKKRLVVLTDIEADPDDAQSLVRLLLYSNDIDIEALIATTSTHQKQRVAPESIRKIVDAYGGVRPNLLKHDREFPAAESLLAIVKQGYPLFGMDAVGEGKDSEGSDFIIEVLGKDDPRPVWIAVWGGPNCLAQALWKIREAKPAAEAEELYSKLRVYTIGDQDDSGPWIRKTFPTVFYIPSNSWRGIAAAADGSDTEVVSPAWLAANIQQGHGPLGAEYPDISYSMEGDTPSYLGLIRNGLNEMEHPDWGGWGGRYEYFLPAPEQQRGGRGSPPEPEIHPNWFSVPDSYSPASMIRRGFRRGAPEPEIFTDNQVTVWRWRTEYQNDFAARMDWTIKPFEEANHPPVARLSHPEEFKVNSGQYFRLDADGSYDPDGDSLSYFWFQYPEVGTYEEMVSFGPFAQNLYNLHTIRAPEVTSPQTVHFILKVTDKGTPPLTRYKRVIVTFEP